MSVPRSSFHLFPLAGLALAALLAACIGGSDLPEPMNPEPQTPQSEQGYTDCGTFPRNTPVRCQPGQYCRDQTFSECVAGCLSDTNCARNQVCDKAAGQQVGTCQNTSTPACSASQPCPSGQTCNSGKCVASPTTPACSASQPCPSGQTCVSGVCSTPSSTSCTPRADGLDGCPSQSLCDDDDGPGPHAPACYAFQACDAAGRCPTGFFGAVCNDNYIPNKAAFCIPDYCRDATNCPSNWACVRYPSTAVLGQCSDRGPGAFCTQDSECLSNKCNKPSPGSFGSCAF